MKMSRKIPLRVKQTLWKSKVTLSATNQSVVSTKSFGQKFDEETDLGTKIIVPETLDGEGYLQEVFDFI